MNRISNRQLPRLAAEISITPLLDLMLVLLLAVVVLVPVLEDRPSFLQEKGEVNVFVKPKKVIELLVKADLEFLLDGKALEHAKLIPEMQSRVIAEPELGVLLHIRPSLLAPRLLELMDALRQAGVKHTSVSITEAPKP
ncbi:MAG: Biopolymer transport protein ExbD/TolR [Verrucomicrobiota bacterium]|jgi:biopolymer transport protein ExbD/biopolymer transport protein TolR